MIQPVCHVATEILEVLASGRKNFKRSQKNTWRLSCWKMNRSEKTQSAAFTYDPDVQYRVPRRHGNLGSAYVWRQKLLAVTKKTTSRLSCWKMNPPGGYKLLIPTKTNLSIYLPICLSGLSIYISVYLSICLSVCLSIYLWLCLSVCLSICLSVCLSVYLSICLSVYLLSVFLSFCSTVYLSICLSVYLSICLSVYLSISLSIYRSIDLSIYRSIDLSIYLPIYLWLCLSVYLSVYLQA